MTSITTSSKRTVTKWVCDVCKIASFEDYDEACQHESQCTGRSKESISFLPCKSSKVDHQETTKTNNGGTIKPKQTKKIKQSNDIHSFFQKPKERKKVTMEAPPPTLLPLTKSKTIIITEDNHPSAELVSFSSSSSSSSSPMSSASSSSSPSSPTSSSKRRRRRRQHQSCNESNENNEKSVLEQHDQEQEQDQHPSRVNKKIRKSKTTTTTAAAAAPLASIFTSSSSSSSSRGRKSSSTTSSNKNTKTNTAPLAVIFGANRTNNANNTNNTNNTKMVSSMESTSPSSCTTTSTRTTTTTKSMLGEHRAADFLMKRRQKLEEERQRQLKRNAILLQQQQQQQQQQQVVVAIDVDDQTDENEKVVQMEQLESNTGYNNNNNNNMMTNNSHTMKYLMASAPRYPRTSHVLPSIPPAQHDHEETTTCYDWISTNQLEQVKQTLTHTLKYPHGKPPTVVHDDTIIHIQDEEEQEKENEIITIQDGDIIPKQQQQQQQQQEYSTATTTTTTTTTTNCASPLDYAMNALLTPPPPSLQQQQQPKEDIVWSTKYGIHTLPNDVVGKAKNQDISLLLLKFVEDWKIERTKALQRMMERQEELHKKGTTKKGGKSRKAKKKKRNDHDEAYRDDTRETFDYEDGLCNVCLVTGPTGSGKTNLIHAVASTTKCQVLEINTTQIRGGPSIKRIMEEATQSHSFQLGLTNHDNDNDESVLQQQEQYQSDPEKYNEDGILLSEDEDDDYDDETHEASTKKGSSVSIILIDEVDNIYENNGDAGFWTALSHVAKKAKCPIFLTANVIPEYLKDSSSIRYEHFETSLPTPMECASKIYSIIKMEHFGVREENFTEERIKYQLAHIAELCHCDLRRIFLELQLFAKVNHNSNTNRYRNADSFLRRTRGKSNHGKESPPLPSSSKPNTTTSVGDTQKKINSSSINVIDHHFPTITKIIPQRLPSGQYSLVTLKGQNFLSQLPPLAKMECDNNNNNNNNDTDNSSWEVHIGDQPCPAMRIMDDTTMLVVCPPCCRSTSTRVEKKNKASGVYFTNETGQESMSCRYAPVTIRSCVRMGIISTLDSIQGKNELCNGSILPSSLQHARIEYHFPPPPNKILWRGEFDSCSDDNKNDDDDDDDDDDNSEYEFDHTKPDCRKAGRQSNKKDTKASSTSDGKQGKGTNDLTTNIRVSSSVVDPLEMSELDVKLLASEIVKKGENVWKSRHPTQKAPMKKFWYQPPTHTNDDVEAWSKRTEVASDIALLEESFEQGGIPYLSGAMRGFGSDFVDDFTVGGSETDSKKLGRAANVKPPSNEKLVASGWNDNFCYFGDSDAYVTKSTSTRERQLLRRSEASERGLSLAESDYSQTAEEIDEESTYFPDIVFANTPETRFNISEENSFLPNRTQTSLFALPELLQKDNNGTQLTDTPLQFDDPKFTSILESKRDDNLWKTTDLLSYLLEDAQSKMFCRRLPRLSEGCVYLPDEDIDRSLFLDYLPTLRSIAVYETAAQFAFDEIRKTDPEKAMGLNGRNSRNTRSTRQNAQQGRDHYFDCLSKSSQGKDIEWTGRKLGEKFAENMFCSKEDHPPCTTKR